ncbi:MAG: hypothetical protein Q9168_007988 [Polycauliona sp. 1 TL-2023]
MSGDTTKYAMALNSGRPTVRPPQSFRSEETDSDIQAKEMTPSFPFMKLPTELRIMIYNYHFFQAVALPRSAGRFIVNQRVHLGNIWLTCKAIYQEAMPIYFSTQYFIFPSIGTLGRFLTTIPQFHRQHITKLCFGYSNIAPIAAPNVTTIDILDIKRTFDLLADCSNLTELCIYMVSPDIHQVLGSRLGFKSLLGVRGISRLQVDPPAFAPQDILTGPFATIEKRLAVLKKPYSAGEVKRREARGISKETVLRTAFDGSAIEAPPSRYPKRHQRG